jgi:hypothetical protein
MHKKKSGRPTWQNKDKSQYFHGTIEKWEIEVFNGQEKHMGVIKPSDGVLRKNLAKPGRKMKK